MNSGGAPRYITPKISKTYDSQKKVADKLISRDRKRLATILKRGKQVFPKDHMNILQKEMKEGFKENEKKYGKLVKDTYNKVLEAVIVQQKKHIAIIQEEMKRKPQNPPQNPCGYLRIWLPKHWDLVC